MEPVPPLRYKSMYWRKPFECDKLHSERLVKVNAPMKAHELLIHLGHHKTGTTTLQKMLTQSREALMKEGILFPDLYPYSGNGIILGYHLLDDKTDDAVRANWLKVTPAQAQQLSRSEWSKIVRMIQENQPKTLLLSSESYFKLIRKDTMQQFDQLTNDVAQTKTAIAYLRAPDNYFLSVIQQRLKKVRPIQAISRTRIRDTIEPLYEGWSGDVNLHIFDRSTLCDGDIVTDFVSKHLPSLDQSQITCPKGIANASMSAEAMSLLYDCNRGRLNQNIAPQVLIDQILKADRKVLHPTKLKLSRDWAEILLNWSVHDLFWLRDTKNITFPNIDYDAIKMELNATDPVEFERVEQFCEVNPDRKAALYARAEKRAKLPDTIRRWLSNW